MLTRDGGRSDSRDGALIGLRWYPLDVDALEAAEGVRRPLKLSFGGATRGDSGRGSEGRRTRDRGIEGPGPTDLLKFTGGAAREGVVGTAKVLAEAEFERRVTYLLLFIGTKMPDPGTDVAKYLRPSTSPLFFPRGACSLLSSMPANLPGLPATVPRNLTVPNMPPGTFTRSPTWTSSIAVIGGDGEVSNRGVAKGGEFSRQPKKKNDVVVRRKSRVRYRAQRRSWLGKQRKDQI